MRTGKYVFSILVFILFVLTACTQNPKIADTKPVNYSAVTEQPVNTEETAEKPMISPGKNMLKENSFIMMDVVDELNAWLLTKKSFLRTEDGGSTWQDVTPQEANLAGEIAEIVDSRVNAEVIDGQNAWLAVSSMKIKGVNVFWTTDGGRTWDKSLISSITFSEDTPLIKSMRFINPRQGWILVSYGAALGSEAAELFHTPDGGKTWRSLAVTKPGAISSEGLPFGGFKMGFAMANQERGWITGFSHNPGVWLLQSDNGGEDWGLRDFSIEKQFQHGEWYADTHTPLFFSDKEGILPVSYHEEGKPTIFYRTVDRGDSWEAGVPVSSQAERELVWDFSSMDHGVVTDGDWVYITEDGGKSWQSEKLETDVLKEVIQLDFINEEIGWALTPQQVLVTKDGGLTWRKLTVDN